MNAYLYDIEWEDSPDFPWDTPIFPGDSFEMASLPWAGLRYAGLGSGVMIDDVPAQHVIASCYEIPIVFHVHMGEASVYVGKRAGPDVLGYPVIVPETEAILFSNVTGPQCGLLTTLVFANRAECVLAAQSARCGIGGDVVVGLPMTPNGGNIIYRTNKVFSCRLD
jgi:hypothetical protein